jgi:hypothetical protein
MKPITFIRKRLSVSLALCTTLVALPLGSLFQSAEAKPKPGAPAHGYRAKHGSKKAYKRAARRNDRNTARANRRNDRYDDRRRDNDDDDDRYSDDRDYVTRYRTITNSAGERVRQYFRVYR